MEELRRSVTDLLDLFDEEDKYQLARKLVVLIELPAGAAVAERVAEILERDLSEKERFRVKALSQIIRDTRISRASMIDNGEADAKIYAR